MFFLIYFIFIKHDIRKLKNTQFMLTRTTHLKNKNIFIMNVSMLAGNYIIKWVLFLLLRKARDIKGESIRLIVQESCQCVRVERCVYSWDIVAL